jgi:heptosyltransferase-3
MTRLELPPRPTILVVALRRLGDVLLTTPLIRSLKCAWPDATIDALVFADTAGILEGNRDLAGVVTMPAQPSAVQSLRLAARLFRRYDLAVSTQPGDRPSFFAFIAGRASVGPVERRLSGHLKRMFFHRSKPVRMDGHRVEQVLDLATLLGITPIADVVTPRAIAPSPLIPLAPYAVIHAAPMFRYKQWTPEGWRRLAAALRARGLTVAVTGGPGSDERRYLDAIWQDADVIRLDGRLGWPDLAGLLAGARTYIGPDTSVTHLAAASGCPTVALYGPTDPRQWGPWPSGGLSEPWNAAGTLQRRGNVFLVQNPLPCLPCQNEGCERRLDSYSRCLDELPLAQVLTAVDRALAVTTV